MRQILLGVVVGVLVAGCAGAGYRYYNLQIPDGCYQDGVLLGPKPKDDRPLTECRPGEHDKAPCMVFKTDEGFRLLSDLDRCLERLKGCERGIE